MKELQTPTEETSYHIFFIQQSDFLRNRSRHAETQRVLSSKNTKIHTVRLAEKSLNSTGRVVVLACLLLVLYSNSIDLEEKSKQSKRISINV